MNKRILIVFLIFLITTSLFSLELGGNFRIGNLSLDQIESTAATTFDGMDFNSWGLSFYVNQNITDNLKLDAGFYSDPILKNVSYTLFSYRESILKLGVGPFFGFFNDASLTTILKSGISTSISVELPGILFVDFRADSSLAGRLSQVGDYIQERTDLSFGFYVKNAICTVNIFSKKFSQKTSATLEVIDALTEYSFKTNIYQKNTPYRITISLAYQSLSKTFIDSSAAPTTTTLYVLGSLICGTKFEMDITDAILYTLDVDNSVYTFGQEQLLGTNNPGPGGYAFRLSTGIKINLDKLTATTDAEEITIEEATF